MPGQKTLEEKHSLLSETIFQLKAFVFICKRLFQNIFSDTKKFRINGKLTIAPIIASSESDLWNPNDNEKNWILTAGKVQNLRIAAQQLNGIEVPKNLCFSFWKQLGKPTSGKGYTIGREIREGCILPTIAGGLCQLSNALYDAALKAGFEILERHQHTKVIRGSLAEQNRDATVKWNYVDLRFRADQDFRIEVDISSDKLIVKFRSFNGKPFQANLITNEMVPFSQLKDCLSCDNFECFENNYNTNIKQKDAITSFILDQKWEEYNQYVQTIATDRDYFITPVSNISLFKPKGYTWTIKNVKHERSFNGSALRRSIAMRLAGYFKTNIFSESIDQDKKIAEQITKLIPFESTHLVVAQNLLPFLLEQGALGGRSYDVLMNRLPMEILQERLDMAYHKFPESPTLKDFRASKELVTLENKALMQSNSIITPHKEIGSLFLTKSIILNWDFPEIRKGLSLGKKILFPASALGRKGAYEVRQLAKDLHLSIVVLGKATEDKNFWNGEQIEYAGNNPFDDIGLVVYPTYIENQPRILIKALANGIPVITTTASGLSPMHNLTIIPIGDAELLKQAVEHWVVGKQLN